MKYTKQQRHEIGRQIYTGTYTAHKAAQVYDISYYTAREYLRQYTQQNNLAPKNSEPEKVNILTTKTINGLENLNNMSKDELIDEVIRTRVELERAKKGYTVKGSGVEKEFIYLSDKNSK